MLKSRSRAVSSINTGPNTQVAFFVPFSVVWSANMLLINGYMNLIDIQWIFVAIIVWSANPLDLYLIDIFDIMYLIDMFDDISYMYLIYIFIDM